MYFKKLSSLFLVVCAVFSNLEICVRGSASEASIVSQSGIFINGVFHQGGSCTKDIECLHAGKCEVRNGAADKSCSCRKGTSGVFCEVVDECSDEKCGVSDDVFCTYDVPSETAVCQCQNDSKTYVSNVKKCATLCRWNSDCVGRWSTCRLEIGEQKFCECREGSSGENCEIVDQCRDEIVDCGVDNNATCVLGDEGKAYCTCNDDYHGFDNLTKTCKDCDCGDHHAVFGCDFVEGKKKCRCEMNYYSNDEGKCIDCKCGRGSIGCQYENGKRKCICYYGYAIQGDVCVDCKCGPNAECKFEDDKAVCTCMDDYMPSGPNGTCFRICNERHPCENGGTCKDGVCSCLNGTDGELCRTIDDCSGFRKCGEAECLFDAWKLEAYCKCANTSLTFEEHWKRCQVCDCGPRATSCTFKYPFQKCTCEKLYADRGGKCTLCSCKGPTDQNCRFDSHGKQECHCTQGYIQAGNECKSCDCGRNGRCEFSYFDEKQCTCDEGYAYDGKKCRVCDCGRNGSCHIYGWGDNRCSCYKGNTEFHGKCLECNCGENADCFFNSTGGKECLCHPEYAMTSNICTPCSCGAGNNCTFDENFNNGTKQCICLEGWSDDRGTCKECNCSLEGANCTFANGLTKCHCPEGYTEGRNNTSAPSKAFCQDVDECLQSGVCPSSTTCVNTVGSYECVCKEGYNPPPEMFGYSTKVDGCRGTYNPWKTAGIVIGCLICGMILIGGVLEFRKKRDRTIRTSI